MTSTDRRRQTERRSHSDLGEFWRCMKKLGGVSASGGWGELSCEPSRRPCPLGKGFPTMAHPRGKTDRQTEPHRVNVMVTVAGMSLASSRCLFLVEMPDLWVWWE